MDQRRSTVSLFSQLWPVCFLHSHHISLGIPRSRVSILRATMSQFPATIKAITFSKTGDVDVIEKTDQPFPRQGPGDVILKVRAVTI